MLVCLLTHLRTQSSVLWLTLTQHKSKSITTTKNINNLGANVSFPFACHFQDQTVKGHALTSSQKRVAGKTFFLITNRDGVLFSHPTFPVVQVPLTEKICRPTSNVTYTPMDVPRVKTNFPNDLQQEISVILKEGQFWSIPEDRKHVKRQDIPSIQPSVGSTQSAKWMFSLETFLETGQSE